MTDAPERTLQDILDDPEPMASVFLWVAPPEYNMALQRIREASSIWLVERFNDRFIVETHESDVEDLASFVGEDSLKLTYGSRYSARDMGLFERGDVAAHDRDRHPGTPWTDSDR